MDTDRLHEPSTDGRERVVVVGLVATPPDHPARIVDLLSGELAELLSTHVDRRVRWEVRSDWGAVAPRRDAGLGALLDDVAQRRETAGWDITICLTDLPLHVSRLPLVAHYSLRRRIGLVSLPALGLGQVTAARAAVLGLVEGLAVALVDDRSRPREEGVGRLVESVAPVRRVVDDADDGEIGFVSSRITGGMRLLAGMVRANRPGRALLGLSKLVVGAFGTAAFALTTNTIWQMGAALDGPRLTLIMLLSLVGLVVWLIVAHDLWERASGETPRELARLFNAAPPSPWASRPASPTWCCSPEPSPRPRSSSTRPCCPRAWAGRSARPTTRCSRGSSPRWPRWAAPSAPVSRTRTACAPPPTATTRHPPAGATTPRRTADRAARSGAVGVRTLRGPHRRAPVSRSGRRASSRPATAIRC